MSKFDKMMVSFQENIASEINQVVDCIKDKFISNRGKGAILGMSGGIDCCVVARLLQEADVPVLLVKMPYGKSMEFAGDNADADIFISKFNFKSMTLDITEEVDLMVNKIKNQNIELTEMARANIMPRVRMINLYAIGQTYDYRVVGTGNLSEITMGYFTKWGDGGSDFNPLAGFTKTEVRVMARYLGIPENIIVKAPSANLWENQTDEDEMGMTYAVLDRYILTGEGSEDVMDKVERTKKMVAHKNKPIPIYERKHIA